MTSKALIIPAAGAGKRMERRQPKPFIKLGNKTILEHTLRRFLGITGLSQIVISTSASFIEDVEQILAQCIGGKINWQCVEGGAERQHSIHNALKVIDDVDLVLVHDAVRPFIKIPHINECCNIAEEMGAAVIGIPVKDTIKKIDRKGFVTATPRRKTLWQIQTPQVFKTALLKKAYQKAGREGFIGTDDASLVEWLGKPVKVVKGSVNNIKITYPQDLKWAELLIENETK